MKKNLFLIASAIILCFTSCSEVECDHNNKGDGSEFEKTIVGIWYEETMNEEIHYSENGTLYDRYSNWIQCAEIEGRYEYDKANKKLTYRWSYLGQNQQMDYSVKKIDELNLTIYSDKNGSFSLEKIVEDYNLRVGETASIKFSSDRLDYKVLSYSSNNERLASVTSEGLIKAEGEKGITYIKVATDKGNVWVKVTVGDNCADLWHDYVSIIGMDYTTMRNTLSNLGDPYTQEDDYALGFIHSLHDVVDISKIFLCPEERTVNEIQLLLKDAVTEAPVLAYMDSHYYKISEDNDIAFYSTAADKESSKAIIAYRKSEKTVFINETHHFFHPHVKDLWYDFTETFGNNKEYVKSLMEKCGYPFVMSDYSYSKNGSEYYSIKDNSYATMVGFVYNPDNQVSEFWVYMYLTQDHNEIYSYLIKKYTRYKEEETEYNAVFYNEDKTMRVVLDLINGAVVYTDLTLPHHQTPQNELWPDLSQYFNMSAEQLKNEIGIPYSETEKQLIYFVSDNYLSMIGFVLDTETGLTKAAIGIIKDEANIDEMYNFLKEKYYVYEKGTNADESFYAFTNNETLETSTVGITLDGVKRSINYAKINSASSKARAYNSSINNLIIESRELKSMYLNIQNRASAIKRNLK